MITRPGRIQSNVLIPDSLYIEPAAFTRVVSGPYFWRRFSPLLLNSNSGKVISKNNGEFKLIINDRNYRLYVHAQNQFNFSICICNQADTVYTGNLRYSILRPFMLSLRLAKRSTLFTDPEVTLRWHNLLKTPAPSKFLEKAYLYLTSSDSIYGYKITQGTVSDTLLLSRRDTVEKTQIWSDVKTLNDSLRKKALSLMLKPQNSSPIFHVDIVTGKPRKLVLFTGINIIRRPAHKETLFTEMPTGNVLFLDFQGGQTEEAKAQRAMGLYIHEHQRQQPFLTWQRFLNYIPVPPPGSDTNRWKRRLYYPVL